jgi:hypothetical protein
MTGGKTETVSCQVLIVAVDHIELYSDVGLLEVRYPLPLCCSAMYPCRRRESLRPTVMKRIPGLKHLLSLILLQLSDVSLLGKGISGLRE